MLDFLLSLFYYRSKLKFSEYPLAILYFHHVLDKPDPYHPDDFNKEEFAQLIEHLSKHFNILKLSNALTLLEKGILPTKALVLTFDDGYQDNYINALPVLEAYECSATFFIASKGIEQGYLWNDQVEQLTIASAAQKVSKEITGTELSLQSKQEKIQSFNTLITYLKFLDQKTRTLKIKLLEDELGHVVYKRTMMTKSQVKQLAEKEFIIGAHTHSHTILSTESKQVSRDELETNKAYLEAIISNDIDYIAFPNGLYNRDYNSEHCDIAKQLKFKFGFSTNDGGATCNTPKFSLPRFMPYRRKLHLFSLSIAKIAGEINE